MKTFSTAEWIGIVIALIVVGFLFILPLFNVSLSPVSLSDSGDATSYGGNNSDQFKAESALVIDDQKLGSGEEAKTGDIVEVHYIGTFTNGQVFDSSRDRGIPFQFQLGGRQVIAGWEQGVLGMKEGGVRRLSIPPELAYGNVAGHPLQNETLNFEIELLNIESSN